VQRSGIEETSLRQLALLARLLVRLPLAVVVERAVAVLFESFERIEASGEIESAAKAVAPQRAVFFGPDWRDRRYARLA
jgi:hypothetical protein